MKKVSKKSTIKIPIISNFNIDKIEIRSNYIFCRPIIKKIIQNILICSMGNLFNRLKHHIDKFYYFFIKIKF